MISIYIFSFSTRNIYTENLRTATASDTYIIHGDLAGEIYEPTYDCFSSLTRNHFILFLFRFTIHGFRYVAIFGPPQVITMDDVNCSFIHSETTLKGHFASSNPIVNQIQHNIQWTQLSNLMSVPTDWFVIFIYLSLKSFS
jgi:alpha-L-rhamnosidase